jgi:mono/diheme cytochrome c family protein
VYPKIPDFTDARWHSTRTDDQLTRSILEGKDKSMPAMRQKLGSLDVKQVVAFVRAFRGGNQVVDDEPEESAKPERPARDRTRAAGLSQSFQLPPVARGNQHNPEASRIFQRFCAMCHGPDGTGSGFRQSVPSIPDFTLPAWHEGRSDSRLVVSVLDGKGTKMPSFAGRLTREQARGLVSVVRSFAPLPARPVSADMEEFDARFRQLTDEFESLGRQIRSLSTPKP